MQSSPGIKLGSLAGAPIRIAPSFVLLAALIGLVNAPGPAEFGAFGQSAWLLPIGFVGLLFLSVLLHELAHAVAGLACGNKPVEIVVNIWGGHTQFRRADPLAGRSALVAAAGPLSNLLLALAGWLVLWLTPPMVSIPTQLLTSFIFVNVALGVFNLVPGLPMDGGYLLEAAVWGVSGHRWKGTLVAGWVGRLVAVALVLYAVSRVLSDGSIVVALWGVLVAVVLWQSASAALRAAAFRRRADELDLGPLVRPAVAVPQDASLDDVLHTVSLNYRSDPQFAVIMTATGPIGIVQPGNLIAVPPDQRRAVLAARIAEPHHRGDVIELTATGDQLVERLATTQSNNLVVMSAGQVVGVIPGQELMSVLTAKVQAPSKAPRPTSG